MLQRSARCSRSGTSSSSSARVPRRRVDLVTSRARSRRGGLGDRRLRGRHRHVRLGARSSVRPRGPVVGGNGRMQWTPSSHSSPRPWTPGARDPRELRDVRRARGDAGRARRAREARRRGRRGPIVAEHRHEVSGDAEAAVHQVRVEVARSTCPLPRPSAGADGAAGRRCRPIRARASSTVTPRSPSCSPCRSPPGERSVLAARRDGSSRPSDERSTSSPTTSRGRGCRRSGGRSSCSTVRAGTEPAGIRSRSSRRSGRMRWWCAASRTMPSSGAPSKRRAPRSRRQARIRRGGRGARRGGVPRRVLLARVRGRRDAPDLQGGLGVLAGDHLKSRRPRPPARGRRPLYREGYFSQRLDDVGRPGRSVLRPRSGPRPPPRAEASVPLEVVVDAARASRARSGAPTWAGSTLYLLDTGVEGNSGGARTSRAPSTAATASSAPAGDRPRASAASRPRARSG